MECKHDCWGVKIIIGEAVFEANLVVLKAPGINVILGMDWLSSHQGCIECATKTISLTNPQGTQVSYIASRPTAPTTIFYHLEEVTIDKVHIVLEYPYIFLDKLPCLPLDREVEFVINLTPSMASIAKSPYFMSCHYLEQFKKQLTELDEKVFIHSSSSPLESPVLFV